MTMAQRFTSRYRGKRYSLDIRHVRIWKTRRALEIIETGEIGIELTEGFMMDPEASVSGAGVYPSGIARTSRPARNRFIPRY